MNQTAEIAKEVGQNVSLNTQQGSVWGMVVYCLVIVGILYLFMIRPNKKRMAEYQRMVDSIKVGNRILAAGIYGTVKQVKEKTIEMEIAKGVVIEVSKNAVAGIEEN